MPCVEVTRITRLISYECKLEIFCANNLTMEDIDQDIRFTCQGKSTFVFLFPL
jgi:hypothetical protein